MGFGNNEFKSTTSRRQFLVGSGLVIDLQFDLPRKYDENLLGPMDEKGFLIKGYVVDVLGWPNTTPAPQNGSVVDVLLRPFDLRIAIFEDIEKIREERRFLLEGVTTSSANTLEARWIHGAGSNRNVDFAEIVSPPNVSFDSPMANVGSNGRLNLHLDGSPTFYDVRVADGSYSPHELPFPAVVGHLKTALDNNARFSIWQRVLIPSRSVLVDNLDALNAALTAFRAEGLTGCLVRSFVAGTSDLMEVDVQVMSWYPDTPAVGNTPAKQYDVPVLRESPRFVALRDGAKEALMEVIPGRVLNLIGNQDVDRSTKHKFAREIVRGLSDRQMNMYGALGYGPGVCICAVAEDGSVSGMTRLAVRTEGVQYRDLHFIPSPHLPHADKLVAGGVVRI